MYNAFKLNHTQRKTLAILACVIAFTGSRVDLAVAAALDIASSASSTETIVPADDDGDSRGIQVPPSYLGKLDVAGPVPAKSIHYVDMTAYNSEVGQTDSTPFITANGTRVRDGIVAANFLKFNTRIRIPELYGDKIFVVTDRMNKRYTSRVDIWMQKKSAARKFGVKHKIKIEVL